MLNARIILNTRSLHHFAKFIACSKDFTVFIKPPPIFVSMFSIILQNGSAGSIKVYSAIIPYVESFLYSYLVIVFL